MPQDFLDPPGDIGLAAAPGSVGEQPATIAKLQVGLNSFPGELGDGRTGPRSLVPKPRVELVRAMRLGWYAARARPPKMTKPGRRHPKMPTLGTMVIFDSL